MYKIPLQQSVIRTVATFTLLLGVVKHNIVILLIYCRFILYNTYIKCLPT